MARLVQRTLTLAVFLNFSLHAAAAGTQFITGPCTSDADCASACCGFNSGLCAGPIVAQERDGGCGFGNPQPNDNAAQALRGSQATAAIAATTLLTVTSPAAAAQASGAGNGAGKQFITGPCTSDADCASACCGFNSGLCAGPIVAQERDGGCGFGNSQPNDNAAQALRSGQPVAAVAAAAPSTTTTGNGTQFITGPCTSDADCASACCGFKSGLCAGPIVAQERDGGCGFGDAQPNDIAAQALRGGQSAATPAAAPVAASMPVAATPATSTAAGTTANGAGNKSGKQFITGACTSDADCASGCCGFNSGLCAGPVVAQERDGGCGFGDAQPNDNAAKALQGR